MRFSPGSPAVRLCLGAAMLLCAGWPAYGTSVCDDPGEHSFAAAGVVDYGSSLLDPQPGSTAQRDQSLQLLVRMSGHMAFGYDHRYTEFGFEGIDPQTNAHLHSAAFPLHWTRSAGVGSVRVALAPTLSTSSNVLGHPQEYSIEILQLPFAIVWERPLSDNRTLRYGVCGDDRFGRYRILPAAVFAWRPHPDWELELGFPVTRVSFSIGDALRTGLAAMPDGSEWHVADRGFEAESAFVHEAYVVEWTVALDVGEHLSVAAGYGRQMGNRFRMTLASGERVEAEGEYVSRTRLEVRWRF